MSAGGKLILASGSQIRAQILNNAGVKHTIIKAEIDERAIETSIGSAVSAPDDLAELLAQSKASHVSAGQKDAFVIGADQTLSFDGRVLHKPSDMEGARKRLLLLQGQTHYLNSAICLVKDSEILWSHVSVCALTMRPMDPGFIGRHLARVGNQVLTSVGAYQIEGEGAQLFEKIEADMFSVMGLPLLPLLAQLRKYEILDV